MEEPALRLCLNCSASLRSPILIWEAEAVSGRGALYVANGADVGETEKMDVAEGVVVDVGTEALIAEELLRGDGLLLFLVKIPIVPSHPISMK